MGCNVQGCAPVHGPGCAECDPRAKGEDQFVERKNPGHFIGLHFYNKPENDRQECQPVAYKKEGVIVGEINLLMFEFEDDLVIPKSEAKWKQANNDGMHVSNEFYAAFTPENGNAECKRCEQ